MIAGKFGDIGELFFEIDLMTADGEIFPVDALLDTSAKFKDSGSKSNRGQTQVARLRLKVSVVGQKRN